MNIVIVSMHSCPMGTPGSSDVGGMNTYLNNLATNLAELDNNVWIFTRSHEECTYVTKPIDSRFKLIHFQIGNSGTDKHDLYDYTEEFAILIREFFNVNCLKIDLIYSHYWLSGIVGESLSESLRIPHFVTFHTMAKTKSKFSPRNFEHPKRQQNEKKVMDSARYIIALSSVESVDIQNLYDIPEEKIIVFPPGVDLQNFYPVDKSVAKEALGMKNHKYILFVGRIDPIKGFEILLEMAQILKKKNEFQLIIVGGGSIRSKELIELQSKIDSKDLSDDVVLVGSVPHQQLKTYYSAVDVFVLTSFYESLGFVILESMACATPVVASNVGGIPTLVDDSLTGFLIDENNPESFAEKVEELLIDNNLNYKMGQEGLKKAKLISWTQMTIQMNSFFEKTIN
tara:strand:+ start:709 stop:1902 length:1194 start_codon:yes stop_codon:yes gene_type:complete